MAKIEGFIAGKEIKTYASKGNNKYSFKDINQYLKKFKLSDALRLIGEVSYSLFKSDIQNPEIKGIPIFDGALAYIAMRLIENSNDYCSQDMKLDNLLTAIDMYLGIPDPLEVNQKGTALLK